MKGAKGVIISITGGEDMRLMEVDEAANHIRELVDPDANIIWGSAFNNDLDGKIRVSVVATGIGAEEVMPIPQPAKVFTFPAVRAAEPPRTEVAPEPECRRSTLTAPEGMDEDEPMELDRGSRGRDDGGADAEMPMAEAADEDEGDELLLDSVDMTAEDEMPAPEAMRAAGRGHPLLADPARRAPAEPEAEAARGRHPVRADVEHRPRRRQGPGRGVRGGRRGGAAHAHRHPRPARHPALPEPAEQSVDRIPQRSWERTVHFGAGKLRAPSPGFTVPAAATAPPHARARPVIAGTGEALSTGAMISSAMRGVRRGIMLAATGIIMAAGPARAQEMDAPSPARTSCRRARSCSRSTPGRAPNCAATSPPWPTIRAASRR